MKKNINILLICLVITSCSTSKSVSYLKKGVSSEIDNNIEETTTKINILDLGAKSTLPSLNEWKKDRDDFILKIEDYLDKNSLIRVKSRKTNNGITIAGTAIGVGGGVYGLVSENQDITTNITSMLVGGLTTVVSTLDLEKKEERGDNCNEFLNIILLDFKYRWSDIMYPNTENELKLYLKEKNQIMERIKKMKCFS